MAGIITILLSAQLAPLKPRTRAVFWARLERETGRNVKVMWLTGRLVPDCKTISSVETEASAGTFHRNVPALMPVLSERYSCPGGGSND